MKPIKIIKNRSDIGAGTRGSDMGIDALEIAAINAQKDFFNRHAFIDVKTHNETIYNKVNHSFAKRIAYVLEQCKRVSDATQKTLQDGFFPLILSGDHSSALGTLAGIQNAYPKETIGVLWIDAHTDLHSPWSTPSGNVHGMPLGAALGLDHKQLAINTLEEETKKHWYEMKNLGIHFPLIQPHQLVYFGIRDYEAQEATLLEDLSLRFFEVNYCRTKGVITATQEGLAYLAACDKLYVSFDVDVFDAPTVSEGTGTPVAQGFSVEEVFLLLKTIFASQKVAALEVAEINPLLDLKGNQMAESTFEILDQLF